MQCNLQALAAFIVIASLFTYQLSQFSLIYPESEKSDSIELVTETEISKSHSKSDSVSDPKSTSETSSSEVLSKSPAETIAERVVLLKTQCLEYNRIHTPRKSILYQSANIDRKFYSLGPLAHHVMRYVNTKQKAVQLPQDFMLCIAPKTGITNWVHFMVSMLTNLKPKKGRSYDHPFFERVESFVGVKSAYVINYTHKAKVENMLFKDTNVVRVINVRHPFARLYSAWKDKLWIPDKENKDANQHTNQHILTHYSGIIQKYETVNSIETKEKNHAVSFEGFLRYLVYGEGTDDQDQASRFYNKHWARFTDLCQPCSLNYNFVTHTETMVEDSRVILDDYKEFSRGWPMKGAYKKTRLDHADYVKKLVSLYEMVPEELMNDLYKFYEWDFRLFGYDIEPFLR